MIITASRLMSMQLKKQKNVGIRFDRNIYNTDDFFSAVIFCGTLQHLDEPFATIKSAVKSLKRGLIFLMTPNAESYLYRRKLKLLMLSPEYNYNILGKRAFENAVCHYGLELLDSSYMYAKSHKSIVSDHVLFVYVDPFLFSSRFLG